MRPKKAVVNVVKRLIESTYIEYQCPKCRVIVKNYSFDYKTITRFLCRCGQEIIADYWVQKSK